MNDITLYLVFDSMYTIILKRLTYYYMYVVIFEQTERQSMELERANMAAERCRFNEQISQLSAARHSALQKVEAVMNSLRTVYQPLTQMLQIATDLGAIPNNNLIAATHTGTGRNSDMLSMVPQSRPSSQAPTPTQPMTDDGLLFAADDRDESAINHLVNMDNGHSNSFLPFTNQPRVQQSSGITDGINHSSSPVPEDAKERMLKLSTSPSKNLILAPFCVACQAHTANVAFIKCGHVCLCAEHCDQMPMQDDMRRCPLCSRSSHTVKLTGLSRN